MQWFRNLKIMQKLLVLVGLCVSFILVVGFVGYHFTNKASNDMTSMFFDRLVPIEQLNIVRSNSNQIQADLFEMTTSRNKAKTEELTKSTNEFIAQTDELIAAYSKTKLDPYEIENLPKLKQLIDENKSGIQKIIALCQSENYTAGYNLIIKDMGNFDKAADIALGLAQYNKKVATEINTQNDKDTALATIIIFSTIILAFIVSIFSGYLLASWLSKRLKTVVDRLQEFEKGNLSKESVIIRANDEIGEIGKGLNNTQESLRNLIMQVSQSAEDISASSEEMSASSEQTAQGAQQTASSTTQLAQGAQEISRNVEQGASNLNKMNKTVQDVLEEAKLVSKLGNDAETNANIGAEHIKKAVNKINSIKKVSEDISVNISELGQLSSDIEQIVDLIKNIAGQTNLLALNAAIEAARAGEHGKGFAVVADEVKKLAGQSAGATEKITSMIKEIQHKTQVAVSTMGKTTQEVEEGVFVVNDAGTALETIIIQVKAANVKIQGITKEIDGVAKSSEEMVQMIENISAITEETAASAEEISSITEEQTASMEEISASSQTLAGVAEILTKQVSVFKI